MSRQGTRRSTILKRRSASPLERLIFFIKRFGIVLGILVLVCWIGAWLTLSGAMGRGADRMEKSAFAMTAGWGFSVKNILVDGRKNADADLLKAMIGVEKNDPILAFDPVKTKAALETIPWVRSAHVERRLPDTIYIRLEERVPFALWQKKQKLVLIDRDGAVLTDRGIDRYKKFLIVLGEGAPQKAAELLGMLEAEPALRERVEAATLMSGRRWDLTLRSGATVKLPEADVGVALRKLAVNHEEESLLDKDVLIIDVREGDRITVRTKPGAAQDFKSGATSTAAGSPI